VQPSDVDFQDSWLISFLNHHNLTFFTISDVESTYYNQDIEINPGIKALMFF